SHTPDSSPDILFCSYLYVVLPTPTFTFFPYTTLFRSRQSFLRRLCHRRSSAGPEIFRPTNPAAHWRPQCLPRTCNRASLEQNRRDPEEHTSELQSRFDLVCRLLLEKKNTKNTGMIQAS